MVANITINCDNAYDIGKVAMEAVTGNNFADIKLHRRNDKIRPLSSMNKTITIQDEVLEVNTTELFSRTVLVKGKKEFADLLRYKLAPCPCALFDDASMRKTKKSVLRTIFEPEVLCENNVPTDTNFIIDGGFLLYNCVWPDKGTTYGGICNKYVAHMMSRDKGVILILADYDAPSNTKPEE